MKLQHLTVIFIIIILPIMLVLSSYIESQIDLVNLRDRYTKSLSSSIHDAMSAYEVNTRNNEYSDNVESKKRDVQSAINTFFKSMSNNLGVAGQTEKYVRPYIPALVFTGYDGYYIYGATKTEQRYTKAEENPTTGIEEGDLKGGDEITEYNLKPYIYYSAEYKNGTDTDVVINYSLDNYITVYGTIKNNFYNKSGYINLNNNIPSEYINDGETFSENIICKIKSGIGNSVKDEYLEIDNCQYFYEYSNENKLLQKVYVVEKNSNQLRLNNNTNPLINVQQLNENGIKENICNPLNCDVNGNIYFRIASGYFSQIMNINKINILDATTMDIDSMNLGEIYLLKNVAKFYEKNYIESQLLADLQSLQVNYMVVNDGNKREVISSGNLSTGNVYASWQTNSDKIFDKMEHFNEHKREVIKMSIQENLKSALANYRILSPEEQAQKIVYKLPIIPETDWDKILSNISMIAFMQDMPIGNSTYNKYAIATSTGNKDYVPDNGIYFIKDDVYHRITCSEIENETENLIGYKAIDFERNVAKIDGENARYFYPQYAKACYKCIVTSDYKPLYDENGNLNLTNDYLKKVYYTALARERAVQYKTTSFLR